MTIKSIEDYSRDELLKITPEETEKVIKFMLAEKGIKLLNEPKPFVQKKYSEPDRKAYQISSIEDIIFDNKETAEEIAKILRNSFSTLKVLERHFALGFDVYTLKKLEEHYTHNKREDLVVKEIRVYSKELFKEVRQILIDNQAKKEQYEKEAKEYGEWVQTTKEVSIIVWNKIDEERSKQQEKENKLAKFEEYVELANGDRNVAWKFMKKAYTVSQEEEDFINAPF